MRLFLPSSSGAIKKRDPSMNWSSQSVNPLRGNSYSRWRSTGSAVRFDSLTSCS